MSIDFKQKLFILKYGLVLFNTDIQVYIDEP